MCVEYDGTSMNMKANVTAMVWIRFHQMLTKMFLFLWRYTNLQAYQLDDIVGWMDGYMFTDAQNIRENCSNVPFFIQT